MRFTSARKLRRKYLRRYARPSTYVSRLLRMTLLAPEIVEAILDGRQPTEMTLAALMVPFAVVWEEQVEAGFSRI